MKTNSDHHKEKLKFFWLIKEILEKYNKMNLLYIFLGFKQPTHSKLKSYEFYILNSPFIKPEIKKEALKIWRKAQKPYHAFQKLFFIYKYNKTSFYDCETDFYGNKLNSLPKNHKMIIYHRGKKYLFRITDIMNIWKGHLENDSELFPKPTALKNPFTNIRFYRNELYNIYLKLELSPLPVPFLIRQFFYLDFRLRLFTTKFLSILRTIAIKNYVDKTDNDDIIGEIEELCIRHYTGDAPKIFNFNKVKLINQSRIINKMKPILLLFYLAEYSKNLRLKKQSNNLLELEMVNFFNLNDTWNTNFFTDRTLFISLLDNTKKKINDLTNY